MSRRGSSNSTHILFFKAEIRKTMYIPVNAVLHIKVGFKGTKIILVCFRDVKRVENVNTRLSEHQKYAKTVSQLHADDSR